MSTRSTFGKLLLLTMLAGMGVSTDARASHNRGVDIWVDNIDANGVVRHRIEGFEPGTLEWRVEKLVKQAEGR